MTNEQKTISLELAKKISEVAKNKGVELLKSEWWWIHKFLLPDIWLLGKIGKEKIPAFDTSELGEMLPRDFYSYGDCYNWICRKRGIDDIRTSKIMHEKTEAEARGEMYLYLLENDLLK